MFARITEGEIRLAILNALATAPSGSMTTTQLIDKLEKSMNPDGKDAKVLNGRKDTYFSQKVRNACGSHITAPSGLAGLGYVVKDFNDERLTITDAGLIYLRSLGF